MLDVYVMMDVIGFGLVGYLVNINDVLGMGMVLFGDVMLLMMGVKVLFVMGVWLFFWFDNC